MYTEHVLSKNVEESIEEIILKIASSMNGSPSFERDHPVELIRACPLCHNRYDPFYATLVSGRDNAALWYVVCRNCFHGLMVVVRVNEQGVNSVGLITDLTIEDCLALQSQQKVSFDDCLELHEMVRRHEDQFLKEC